MGAFDAIHDRRLHRRATVLAGVVVFLAVLFSYAAPGRALVNNCVPSTKVPPPKNRVLRVGTFNGKKGQCKNVQEAVNAAAPGNWILIAPGDYKQSTYTKPVGGVGDDVAGAAVLVTVPNIHIRGLNR